MKLVEDSSILAVEFLSVIKLMQMSVEVTDHPASFCG